MREFVRWLWNALADGQGKLHAKARTFYIAIRAWDAVREYADGLQRARQHYIGDRNESNRLLLHIETLIPWKAHKNHVMHLGDSDVESRAKSLTYRANNALAFNESLWELGKGSIAFGKPAQSDDEYAASLEYLVGLGFVSLAVDTEQEQHINKYDVEDPNPKVKSSEEYLALYKEAHLSDSDLRPLNSGTEQRVAELAKR